MWQLFPETTLRGPVPNDELMHQLVLQRTITALASGQDATDPWIGLVSGMGYPLFHYYQHLPYLLPAAFDVLAGYLFPGGLSVAALLHRVTYLLLSLFPLSIYWSMRRFGFAPWWPRSPPWWDPSSPPMGSTASSSAATSGAAMACIPSSRAWCCCCRPWPWLYRAEDGRGYFAAVLLLSATMLCHLVMGALALGSLAVVALLGGPAGDLWRRVRRLALVAALVALAIAYFYVPFKLDGAYWNRSVWYGQQLYDSYGHVKILGMLVKGELFDFGRFPSLTLLAGLGLAFCIWQWRDPRHRVFVALMGLWLLVYFGRPTWGALLDLVPLLHDATLHRFGAGVHLSGIFLMGLGLALPWRWAVARRQRRYLLAVAALTVLILWPVYRERAAFLAQNTRWLVDQQAGMAAEQGDIDALVKTLKAAPPGRVYAGLATNWGKDYKIGMLPMYHVLNATGLDMVGYLYHAFSLNADIQALFNDGRYEEYDLFNIRYVVTPTGWTVPDFYQPMGTFGRHQLYRVDTTGYFELVDSDTVFAGERDEFYPAASSWLSSALPRADSIPRCDWRRPPAVGRRSRSPRRPRCSPGWRRRQARAGAGSSPVVESNAYTATVDVARASTLMLKATYHPNWHATVDGVDAPTAMLMPSFVGVKLAPGTHVVRLEYRPQLYRRILLALGLLTLLLVLVVSRLAAPRPTGEVPDDASGLGHGPPRGGIRGRVASTWACVGGRFARWPAATALASAAERSVAQPRPAAWAGPFVGHLPYLGGVLLTALIAGFPLFQFKLLRGHDDFVHIVRIVEFDRVLRAGQLFPRWAPDLSAGFGQPALGLYPPFFYYLASLIHTLGAGYIASEDLACLMILVLAGTGMYLLAADLFGRRGGLVAAAAYLCAPYLLFDLYVRSSMSELAAFAFIPFVFWGVYRFVEGDAAGFCWPARWRLPSCCSAATRSP